MFEIVFTEKEKAVELISTYTQSTKFIQMKNMIGTLCTIIKKEVTQLYKMKEHRKEWKDICNAIKTEIQQNDKDTSIFIQRY